MSKQTVHSLPRREDELRVPVQKLFPSDQYFCKSEVRFGLKRIDMLFRRKIDSQEIIAVELKLKDWKRAIWQAISNRQVATYSYVALPSKRAKVVDQQLMVSLGLGLIVTDPTDEARIALPAKRSRHINNRIAREMSTLLIGY